MTDRLSQLATGLPASPALDALPEVVLELRQGAGRAAAFPISHVDFLIGTVPGCDLRVPGSELPAVLCLLARRPGGLALRKLAPTQMILVNGKTVTHAELRDGDRVSLGAADIFVRVKATTAPSTGQVGEPGQGKEDYLKQLAQYEDRLARFEAEREAFHEEQKLRRAELQQIEALLSERERTLQGQAAAFENDRAFLNQQRSQASEPIPEPVPPDLIQREERLSLREAELQDQLADIHRQRQELTNVRQELADIRKQLYDRYQERRDRLAGLQEAVDKAARKVQERKRLVDAEEEELLQRSNQLDQQATNLEDETRRFEDARRTFQETRDRTIRDQTDKANDLQAREHRLAADKLELEGMVKHYQAGMLRLDRQTADIEEREQKLRSRNEDLEHRLSEMRKTSAELEQQGGELEAWRGQLTQEAESLAQIKSQQETTADQLAQQESSLEAQQSTLSALRTRLERQREDLRSQEQHLEEQRLRQEQAEVEIEKQFQESLRVRAELDVERKQRDQERQEILQRRTALEAGEHQLRQAQERQAREEADLRSRTEDLHRRLEEQAEAEADLRERQTQLAQAQAQLAADQENLKQQSRALAHDQQECAALQEKLAVRGDELDAQQQSIQEQSDRYQADAADLKLKQEEWKLYHQEAMDQLCARKQHLEDKDQALTDQGRQLEQQQEELLQREAAQRRQLDQLREAGQNLTDQRQRLAQEREKFLAEQQQIRQEHERTQALFVEMRLQAESFVEQLPEIELQAGATMDRLGQSREQLRDHLNEISAYVRQCQEDMEKDSRQIQDKERTLRQHQDEHRLALVTFRQQLVDWQTQMAEAKRAAGESAGGERSVPDVRPAAPALMESAKTGAGTRAKPGLGGDGGTAPRLPAVVRAEARTSEPKPAAAPNDTQQWYRKKFRDFAGIEGDTKKTTTTPAAPKSGGETDDGDAPLIPIRRDILAVTDPVDPGDRKLGDDLRRLELIDADTLQALLVETRRQRRPLKQVLLAGNVLTIYQLALIEAGDIHGLVMGPVRAIDRVRSTPLESVYRVFDPRRGQEAMLRHLSEQAMKTAGRADEFRDSFLDAMVSHPHLAQTLEVLEVAGRPAALQEWLSGLPATDWPPLVSVPGVCYRLLIQAVQGLDAIHTAGLFHGRLRESRVLLMPDGIVKLSGLGEPAWLADDEPAAKPTPPTPAGDLLSLGQIVAKWCTPAGIRRGAKTKPPPDALVSLVMRLAGEEGSGFTNSMQVLGALELIRKDVPANPEAWDRLLRHVKDHVVPNPLAA